MEMQMKTTGKYYVLPEWKNWELMMPRVLVDMKQSEFSCTKSRKVNSVTIL